MQDQLASSSGVQKENIDTQQQNDGYATIGHIIKQRKDVGNRIAMLSREDVGNGGFSVLDYAAPFGHDFTQHLGVKDAHEATAIRVHVLFRQKQIENLFVGYSFPLCGY